MSPEGKHGRGGINRELGTNTHTHTNRCETDNQEGCTAQQRELCAVFHDNLDEKRILKKKDYVYN